MENEVESALVLIDSSQKSTFLPFWKSILENKNNFNRKNSSKEGDGADNVLPPLQIPHLSPLAHSVISHCSRILQISSEELQQRFDLDLPDKVRQPTNYARNFLEYCSFQTIHLLSMSPDYLSNKDFRRLMYDMMLAWESSGVENGLLVNKTVSSCEIEDEDEGQSLFYSTSTKMAVEVDDKKTVGPEAFARIAPACSIVADIITVHYLFDILTCSSDHRLHFLIFDKYLQSLQKVVKAVSNGLSIQFGPNLSLAEEESMLDVDGVVPTQPVLQHIGISAWPGRLTLTNYALYFESGIGLYDKAVRYDLGTDLKQCIKPELTGPLGARLFDKAVMYKSKTMEEPVYFEFPEFKGSSRRDYWLDICLEILRTHRFIRNYNLKENQHREALARAMLGILRYRAIREGFHLFSSNYRTLLCFNLAESLPGGDVILETLYSQLTLGTVKRDLGSPNAKKITTPPISLLTLHRLGIISCKETAVDTKVSFQVGGVCVGEINPLEAAVKKSIQDSGRAEAARATVDQVKVEGIDTNLAVMKELLGPLIISFDQLQLLISWDQPWKSVLFLVLISYAVVRGWIKYVFPLIFVLLAISMLWHKYTSKKKPLEAFKIKAPPTKNPIEQLLALQEAITQVESLIQSLNIILLKVRALIFAAVPQATDKVSLVLVSTAAAITLLPLKYMILLVFLESFTRNMPLRRASSERWTRRMKEWWRRIPAAPVWLIKSEDKKRK